MKSAANGISGPGAEQTPTMALVEIVVTEELDLSVVRELGVVLDSVLGLRPAQLVIDLAECRYIDAAGIGLLLDTHRRMWRLGGRLTVRSPSPRLQKLFALARVDQVLHVTSPGSPEPLNPKPNDHSDGAPARPAVTVAYGRARVPSHPGIR